MVVKLADYYRCIDPGQLLCCYLFNLDYAEEMMKSFRKAIVLALSLSLAMGGPLAEARPAQSSGSYKSGFSSQKSSTARNNTSRSNNSTAAPAQSQGGSSFGSFGSRRSPEADAPPASGSGRSAMSRDMSQKTAEENALRNMDSRNAANRPQQPLPPLDPVMQRQPPQQPPQYGNNGGYSGNGGNQNGGYNQPGYQNAPPSRWGTAGAAAAGAVIGSVLAGQANASHQPVQQRLPSNVPADVGAIGPVGAADGTSNNGVATVPNPMAPDGVAAQQGTTPAAMDVPAVRLPDVAQRQPAQSGIGWFGWVMLGLIGFGLYKLLTRRKVAKRGANYSLGD